MNDRAAVHCKTFGERELRPMNESEVRDWYGSELTAAFPPHECKALAVILAMRAEGRYEVWGLWETGTLVGYAALWQDPADRSYLLLDYLGVTAARRGGGLGGEILRRLGEKYRGSSRILLESEQPRPGDPEEENEIRARRIAFYRRCGYLPLYDMAACGVRFLTMVSEADDLTRVMAHHRAIYRSERSDVVIPLAPGQDPPVPFL